MTAIQNHYIERTHITFDVRPFTPEQRIEWFHEHSDGRRYRIFVAEDREVVAYAATGAFRSKEAYEITVESSIACSPQAIGLGVGTRLYEALFAAIAQEDIHRVVAGIAQPNPASNALHGGFGFVPIGTFTQVGRKFGKYWDVLWMEKRMPG